MSLKLLQERAMVNYEACQMLAVTREGAPSQISRATSTQCQGCETILAVKSAIALRSWLGAGTWCELVCIHHCAQVSGMCRTPPTAQTATCMTVDLSQCMNRRKSLLRLGGLGKKTGFATSVQPWPAQPLSFLVRFRIINNDLISLRIFNSVTDSAWMCTRLCCTPSPHSPKRTCGNAA